VETNIHKSRRLLELYQSQLESANSFMKIVLTEAIRKLNESNLSCRKISCRKIENWVVRLEKDWMNI